MSTVSEVDDPIPQEVRAVRRAAYVIVSHIDEFGEFWGEDIDALDAALGSMAPEGLAEAIYRAVPLKYEQYPDTGKPVPWAYLSDPLREPSLARARAAVAFRPMLLRQEINDLQETVLACKTLDDLRSAQLTILAIRALPT